jgi:glycosyltransferase involved in cell wall biosynthesis
MEDAWKHIKVLLVPSLWLEAWGMVVVEAQLRGIPVISSDSGALPEAKLGIPYIVPVNSLTGKHDREDNYVVPNQDIEPWVVALEKLLNDKDEYESVADQARSETLDWLTGLDGSAHEKWLNSIEKVKRSV